MKVSTPDRLLRLRQVCDLTGLSRSEIYRRVSRRDLPCAISLGPKCTAWSEREIQQWIADRISARDAEKGG
jgi:prophage regulatory protein